MRTAACLLGVLALVVQLGCTRQVTQNNNVRLPDPGPDQEYTVQWPDLGPGEDRFVRIDLGPDAFELCRNADPKFPFDSAQTRAQDHAQMKALASCLNHSSMLDRKVQLVGRADATGTDAYNRDLGRRRAESIRKLLIESGLSPNRIVAVRSRGEQGAVGNQPAYAPGYDRRVDVVVTGGVHSP
jgi:outer membrane protein OmpA-like peptidoglycan-associated protein